MGEKRAPHGSSVSVREFHPVVKGGGDRLSAPFYPLRFGSLLLKGTPLRTPLKSAPGKEARSFNRGQESIPLLCGEESKGLVPDRTAQSNCRALCSITFARKRRDAFRRDTPEYSDLLEGICSIGQTRDGRSIGQVSCTAARPAVIEEGGGESYPCPRLYPSESVKSCTLTRYPDPVIGSVGARRRSRAEQSETASRRQQP
jgi:hypothetical protein